MQNSSAKKMLKISLQRVEERYPALEHEKVSVICMTGIVSSFSLKFAFAGVFDTVIPRQN
jgi:hypothetical protein